MARTESKAIMGYLPIEERHYPALLSLVAPATPSHRLLDPFANALALGWFNPPYDHDAAASGSKRVEFRYLRHAWKWIQDGGLVLW